MSKELLQPVRMESQFVDTKLQSVIFQAANVDTEVVDGTIAVLGGFAKDPVMTAAAVRNNAGASDVLDINTRIAKAAAAADTGVGVIDIAGVPMAGDYRMGSKTTGLKANAGVPVRFRKLVEDDVFVIGEGNTTAALTVGEWAKVSDGKWAPESTEATAQGTNCYCLVVDKYKLTEGTTADMFAYRLLVKKSV